MTYASSAPPAKASRRTQQERRDGTQRKLLEATLACLAQLGYARTTTTEVARLAQLSQGALFKHYPSKDALLAAAIAHLFAELVAGYQAAFDRLPRGEATAEAAFELLWEVFTGPRLSVAFELYVAARTDPALRSALSPVVRRHRETLVSLSRKLFPEASRENPEFDALVDLLMCSMEGLVVESYAVGDVSGPPLAVLKRMLLSSLTAGASPSEDLRRGGSPWTR